MHPRTTDAPPPGQERITGTDLTRLVEDRLGPWDEGAASRVADRILALTDGLPALVDLVLGQGPEPWQRGADPIPQLTGPGGPLAVWVDSEVLPALPESARTLLLRARGLRPLTEEVAGLLAGDPAAYATAVAAEVVTVPSSGQARVAPLLAAVLGGRAPDPGAAGAWSAASEWYLQHGHHGAALRAARYADDAGACLRLIEEHGDRIVAGGWAGELVAAAETLPTACASLRTRILHGHAARVTGQTFLAERLLTAVAVDARSWGEPAPPDLVWRLAMVHYGRGDFKAAIECGSGATAPIGEGEPAHDRAMRLAVVATARWVLGESDAAARAAAEALAAARGAGDQALATARLAQALMLTGARQHNALAAALAAAERAGDLSLTRRALGNLADAHLFAAEYAEARDAARRAVELSAGEGEAADPGSTTGPPGAYAVAVHNWGEALLGLGELEAARDLFLRGLAVAREHGLERTPMSLWGLAEIEYQAGRLADARAGLEEAVDLARETGERQILVPALARLATVLATSLATRRADETPPGDPERALALAEEAVSSCEDDFRADAVTALGWVRLAVGEQHEAARLAQEAVDTARATGNRRALGPALELAAATATDGGARLEALEQALALYRRSRAGLAADRVQVQLGRLPGSSPGHGTAARAALRRLHRAGVGAHPLHPRGTGGGVAVEIRVLGGFEVFRDGAPVPGSAWRSRQARSLLKVLVARRGRPVGREELCDLLWPDDDPAKTGHRLSVLLSTLRGVLDPDRQQPTEHIIAADSQGVRLVLGQVSLDLQDFLEDAAEAARLADAGDEPSARALLADLLAGYRGEAFEEDPYEAWADEVRVHVRSAWVQSLRLAARLAGRAGDIDAAVTCLVRILAADPYDEPAHRMLLAVLVRARRHGEARRAFDRWLRAMTDIGAEPPHPDLLDPPGSRPGPVVIPP